nr:hypothetical protein [Tanacetum cinerariifolium]
MSQKKEWTNYRKEKVMLPICLYPLYIDDRVTMAIGSRMLTSMTVAIGIERANVLRNRLFYEAGGVWLSVWKLIIVTMVETELLTLKHEKDFALQSLKK